MRFAVERAIRSTLISISSPQHFKNSFYDDLDIEPKAPVVDVPKIKLHTFGNVLNRRSGSTCTITLGPASDPWLNMMPKSVISQYFFKVIVVG